jgi:hypothetical protein
MSEMTDSSADNSDSYFLQDQERWEELEFDWESWNATVEKILQQKLAASPGDPQ